MNCITPAAVRTAIFDQMTQQHIDFMLSKIHTAGCDLMKFWFPNVSPVFIDQGNR